MKYGIAIGFMTSICLLLSACSSVNNSNTGAPAFTYAEDPGLKSEMQQFAYQMQLLEWAMKDNPEAPFARQREISSILRRMKSIAKGIGTEDHLATHQFLANYLNDFQIRLDFATASVEKNPPSYYLAGQISGGCISCHWVRDKAKH